MTCFLRILVAAVPLMLLTAATSPTSIQYSKLADCTEQQSNDNAAVSELSCQPVGRYPLHIRQQSPQYFSIELTANGQRLRSELEAFSQELPMEPGKTLEWHLNQQQPKFLIFRLKVQHSPQRLTEYLTLNLVTDSRICPLARIETAKNRQANQLARDLLSTQFAQVTACPAEFKSF